MKICLYKRYGKKVIIINRTKELLASLFSFAFFHSLVVVPGLRDRWVALALAELEFSTLDLPIINQKSSYGRDKP